MSAARISVVTNTDMKKLGISQSRALCMWVTRRGTSASVTSFGFKHGCTRRFAAALRGEGLSAR